ncbi:unnamed protein product [Rotaria sp. Silwood2]|nr:unnamed protein product [Rotaria sp. Silwood2]CAF4153325.1 unnamed protein product [Rotaria sp. Silwood2]
MLLWLQRSVAAEQLFGVQSINVDISNHTDLLQNIGAQIVRVPIAWRLLEYDGKNKFAPWFLDYLDSYIYGLEKAGLKIIIQMAQTPCWASTSQNCNEFYYRPKLYSDYADAMVFLLGRYGKKIYAWEIWNEPNLSMNWLRPECSGNGGLCPRAASINDEFMEFIDLKGAQEYSAMVKITYQKMKAVDSSVIILAGSLAGSDVDYLNEMYKSGLKAYFTALAMHPYTAAYPPGNTRYGQEYGPDDCFTSQVSSKFWCFTDGVVKIRQYMISKNDGSKTIWFSEFGFSSFSGWNGAGLVGQANHLQRAIDIIQQQWPFVQVACLYEFCDQANSDNREAYFGLFDKDLIIKPSGLAFMNRIKKPVGTTSLPITIALDTKTVYPSGAISTFVPYFSWPSILNATMYLLWVNDYGNPNIGGIINKYYTSSEANCPMGNAVFCAVVPNVQFSKQGGQWWVTAFFNNGPQETNVVGGLYFTIQ